VSKVFPGRFSWLIRATHLGKADSEGEGSVSGERVLKIDCLAGKEGSDE